MAKPVVYVHRAGPLRARYMTPGNSELLRSFADVAGPADQDAPLDSERLAADMRGATAILSLNGTGVTDITTEVLKAVGTVRVAAIAHWWHGCHEPARAMWEAAGVAVIDASLANTEAVAEWTVACALLGVRRLREFDGALKAGVSWAQAASCRAGLLCESVVGLVGFGRIGRHVAGLLRPFGAAVMAYDPYVQPETAAALGVRMVKLDELLDISDVVSLHLPVTPETTGLLGARELARIRDGAVFINSARAILVDPDAFLAELRTGRFSAFLDVFHQEPLPVDDPLRSLPNVFLCPHIAGDNDVMFARCGRMAIEALRDWMQAS